MHLKHLKASFVHTCPPLALIVSAMTYYIDALVEQLSVYLDQPSMPLQPS
jgi:hypothetical protein